MDNRVNQIAYSHRLVDTDAMAESFRLRILDVIDIGFRFRTTYYSKEAIKPKYAEIFIDEKRETLKVMVDSIEYLLKWDQIKELCWINDSNQLVIEWDHEVNPKIFKYIDSNPVRSVVNPLNLTEPNRNLIICRLDAKEFANIRRKISQRLIVEEMEELDLEVLEPKELVYPKNIDLKTGLLVEVLVSLSCLPKEKITNKFWKVINSTPNHIVNAALESLKLKGDFLMDPTTALREEIQLIQQTQVNDTNEDDERIAIYTVDITPTRSFLRGPEYEKSNRVLRKYGQYPRNFIRVNFLDEDWKELHAISSDIQLHFRKILIQGISLGGK